MNSIGFYEEDPRWSTAEPHWEAAQALVEARRRSGLTQQALAERSGIRQSVISGATAIRRSGRSSGWPRAWA